MRNCMTCGRFAPEPGVAFGYAGPVCRCLVEPKIQKLAEDYRGHFPDMKVFQPTTDQGDRAGGWWYQAFKRVCKEADKLAGELKEAREVNEKLYAMKGEITRNDARTFGDLMLANAALSAKLAVAVSALEHYAEQEYYNGGMFTVDGDAAKYALSKIKGEGEA